MAPWTWPLPWLVAAVSWALLAALLTARWARRRRRHSRAVRRQRVAAEGEQAAERLLRRRGYAVIGRQVELSWQIRVDGEPVDITLRADLIVRRWWRRYVAEVKTGDVAPSVRTPATRRQLLEYLVAYDVDGVLLVDPGAGAVHRVVFPR